MRVGTGVLRRGSDAKMEILFSRIATFLKTSYRAKFVLDLVVLAKACNNPTATARVGELQQTW